MKGGGKEAAAQHGVEAIQEREADHAKCCLVEFIRQAIEAVSFGGCCGLYCRL